MLDSHRLRIPVAALLWVLAAACGRNPVVIDVIPPNAGSSELTEAGSGGSAGIVSAGTGGAAGAAEPMECVPESWWFWAKRVGESKCRVEVEDQFVLDRISEFLDSLPPNIAEARTPEGCDLFMSWWFIDPMDKSQIVLCPTPCMFLAQAVEAETQRVLQCGQSSADQ